MGLDQYLYAKKYTSPHDFFGVERKALHAKLKRAIGKDTKHQGGQLKSISVEMEVAYWRKANAIHRWFVDTCQDGNDDCRQSYVSREQLQKLLETCKAVLADRTKADELLPTQDGFFFGPTEYDHVYFADVADTATQLENVLELDDSWDFCYSSSW
jgi:hypothetical protein